MTIKELTKIEKRFAKHWYEGEGIKYDPKNINIKFIRYLMKYTAYHEAGHFAARVFTGFDIHHIESVSIIPDEKVLGRVMSICIDELIFEKFPLPIRIPKGYVLLLGHLAGYGVEMIIEKSKYDNLIDYLYYEQTDVWEGDFYDMSEDINKARRIAFLMSKPHWSKDRILSQAAKWTLEMLRIPAVWNIVKNTVKILLQKGEVTSRNREISKIINDPDFLNIYNIPKWKRRLLVKDKDMRLLLR